MSESKSTQLVVAEADAKPTVGRHRFETERFVDPTQLVDLGLVCPICMLALQTAFETACGHLMCQACHQQLRAKCCPVCNASAEGRRSLAWDRLLGSQKVHCVFSACAWTGAMSDDAAHLKDCGHVDVWCPHHLCGYRCPRLRLSSHILQCSKRPAKCQHCDQSFVFEQVREHEQVRCGMAPVKCPLKCTEDGQTPKLLRQDLDRHVELHCPNAEIQCPLGCPPAHEDRALLRKDRDAHLFHPSRVATHLSFALKMLDAATHKPHTGSYQPLPLLDGAEIAVYSIVDVQEKAGGWAMARVLCNKGSHWLINYLGWPDEYNEVIDKKSARFAPVNSRITGLDACTQLEKFVGHSNSRAAMELAPFKHLTRLRGQWSCCQQLERDAVCSLGEEKGRAPLEPFF